ncbi:MAG: hypothetical protein JJ879_11065, partial [Sneathiella sp.]|nr:hypothetical protein [Sneathiella sp.]
MAKTENGIVSGSASGTVVEVEGGQNIALDVTSPDLVVFSQDGSDLIITEIADGDRIVLEGFFSQAGTELPPQLTLADGSVISAADVTGLVEGFDPGAVAPAAGPGAGGTGGGANFAAYNDDGIGDGIGIDGLLDPTALGFPADEEPDFAVALPGQPELLLNEIGLGVTLLDDYYPGNSDISVRLVEGPSLVSKMLDFGSPALEDFLEFGGEGAVDFIELRNNTGSTQNTEGNGPSTVGEGVTTLSIIGPDGAPVSFDLPSLSIPSGGQLVVMQATQEGEETTEIQTIYMIFNADGDIVTAGGLAGVGDWPMGADTTEPLGVLLTWALGSDVSQIDTFLANGAQFVPASLNSSWVPVPEGGAELDIFGDSNTFNGQIATQETVAPQVFDAYAPVTLDDMVAEGPLGEDFFRDIDVNNIFARVDNFDSDTAGDWTTGLNHTIGLVNDTWDPNPQDNNDDMNPGQPEGPEPVVDPLGDEDIDNDGQNVIIVGENDAEFTNEETGVVYGGRAQDFLIGDEESNTLDGGAHNDYLDGGAGNDVMHGGTGGDVLIDDQGSDIMVGGSGTDIIFGRRDDNDDVMYGGEGNDTTVFAAFDSMYGGEIGDEYGDYDAYGDLIVGDNLMMYGGYGNDTMYGDQQEKSLLQALPTVYAPYYYYYGDNEYMRDIIVAGNGSDLIFGDNAVLPAEFSPDYINELVYEIFDLMEEAGEANFLGMIEDIFGYFGLYYGGSDLIYGGMGNDVIFGQ